MTAIQWDSLCIIFLMFYVGVFIAGLCMFYMAVTDTNDVLLLPWVFAPTYGGRLAYILED